VHPPEHRRSGERTDHHRSDRRRQADAFGQLGGDLGEEEDDEDVDDLRGEHLARATVRKLCCRPMCLG
jgi:hypothetical protein